MFGVCLSFSESTYPRFFYHEVPNPILTIRNFFIVVRACTSPLFPPPPPPLTAAADGAKRDEEPVTGPPTVLTTPVAYYPPTVPVSGQCQGVV